MENYFPFEWRLFNLKRNSGSLTSEKLKQEESLLVMDSLKAGDWLVSLDEKGKSLNSRKLAGYIQDRGNESTRRLIFLIGGAYGLDEAVLKKSKFIWSLSDLTFSPSARASYISPNKFTGPAASPAMKKYHHD
ncbi:MAG: 23S rRNA (pseudouridine(1915)-N(3))-methyltransferase RlmH [Puia sp.]